MTGTAWMSVLVAVLALASPVQGAEGEQENDVDGRPVARVIDEYVREAMRSNLSLQSESLEVERNIAALDGARARYLPTVALQARYTRAEGGREIDVPVGTLINPAFRTLNQLLAAQGRSLAGTGGVNAPAALRSLRSLLDWLAGRAAKG